MMLAQRKLIMIIFFASFLYALPVSVLNVSAQSEIEVNVESTAPSLNNINEIVNARREYKQSIAENEAALDKNLERLEGMRGMGSAYGTSDPQYSHVHGDSWVDEAIEKAKADYYDTNKRQKERLQRTLIESSLGMSFSDSSWWDLDFNRAVPNEALSRATSTNDECQAAMDIFFYIQSNLDRLSPSQAVSGFDFLGFAADQNILRLGDRLKRIATLEKRLHSSADFKNITGEFAPDILTERQKEEFLKETLAAIMDESAAQIKMETGVDKISFSPSSIRSYEDAAVGLLYLLNPVVAKGVDKTRKGAKIVFDFWRNYQGSTQQEQGRWKLEIFERAMEYQWTPERAKREIRRINQQKRAIEDNIRVSGLIFEDQMDKENEVHDANMEFLVKAQAKQLAMANDFFRYHQQFYSDDPDEKSRALDEYRTWLLNFDREIKNHELGESIRDIHHRAIQSFDPVPEDPSSVMERKYSELDLDRYHLIVRKEFGELLREEKERHVHKVDSITSVFFRHVEENLDAHIKAQIQQDAIRDFILPLTERQEQQARESIVEKGVQNILELDHERLLQVFGHIGVELGSQELYCLCRTQFLRHLNVRYHPESMAHMPHIIEGMTCYLPGPPCTARGFGCQRDTLPTDIRVWRSCAPSAIERVQEIVGAAGEGNDVKLSGKKLDESECEDTASGQESESIDELCFDL